MTGDPTAPVAGPLADDTMADSTSPRGTPDIPVPAGGDGNIDRQVLGGAAVAPADPGTAAEEILASIDDGIYVIDAQWRFTYLNAYASELLELADNSIVGQSLLDSFPQVQGSPVHAALRHVMNTREPVHFEAIGAIVPCWFSFGVYPAGDGGLFVHFRDISARKAAEVALRASDERFRLALANSPVSVFEQDLGLRYTWIHNPQFASPAAYIGKTDADVMEPNCAAVMEELKRAVIASGHPVRREVAAAPPGHPMHYFDLYIEPRLDARGRVIGISCAAADLTERRQAEQSLRASEEKFRNAFANAAIGFVMTGPDGRFLDCNPAYCRLVGYTTEELRALPPLHLVHPDDIAVNQQLNARMLAGEIPDYVIENRYIRKDGNIVWVRKSLSTMPDGEGRPTSIIGLVEDVTQRRKVEADLRLAKAEAERAVLARSKFLAAASHDLRQPVQSLVLLLEALKSNPMEPRVAKAVALMENALEGLNGLLSSILDVSRLDAGVVMPQMVAVDAGALLTRLVTEYAVVAAEKGLRVRMVPRAVTVSSDPVLLERALRNLIENALRYTETGGLVVGARLRGHHVRLDVVDSGIGIAEDKLPHIFEEFFQVGNPGRDRAKGLGLGLAIVGRLVRLLGAEIQVASRIGHGTRFSLVVPRHDAAPAGPAAEGSAADEVTGRILILEDDHSVRHGLALLIESWGHSVTALASGEEALAQCAEPGWTFDAIVADHRLGPGLSGTEAARRLGLQTGRAIPTVVVTGDTAPERIAEVHASGFAMLHKPVAAEDLRNTLQQLLR